MKADRLTKNYDCLTPEERCCLILAASGRGDEAERNRLVRAGRRITLSMADHAPYAHAIEELALLSFIELQEDAARYLDAFTRAGDDSDWSCDKEEQTEVDDSDADGDEAVEVLDGKADAESADDDGQRPAWQQSLNLALAAGYVLRTKADGWKLFCEQMHVTPFLMWEGYPGFDRLERALGLAEKAAFVPEAMLRWLNSIRPAEEPALTELGLTAASVAAATEEVFRQRVGWWGG